MEGKKIFGVIGLSVVTALIITVLILSFVTVKFAPTFDNPTLQVSVSKYSGSQEYKYRMDANTTNTIDKNNYKRVVQTVNSLGEYSIMQKMFLGISKTDLSITNEQTKTFKELHKMEDGYLIELSWDEEQILKNVDGTEYKDDDNETVKFTKVAIFADNSDTVTTYKIYIKTYTSDSSYSYYYYTAYTSTKALYDLAQEFDEANRLSPVA